MIKRKSRHQVNLMRKAGEIASRALYAAKDAVKPGISTLELDKIAEDVIKSYGAIPSFKGYRGFPGTICSSVNEQVVHGIPSADIILKEGDVISIDVGATYRGMVGDNALTIPVGKISPQVEELLNTTNEALHAAITQMKSGNYLEDVSAAIEDKALEKGLGIVRQYGGHGVGADMHEDPFLFNYRTGDRGPLLKSGMIIAIEPMFNLGCDEVHTEADNWTVSTDDGAYSAHFEHTVLVTDDDPEIMTTFN